MEGRKWEELPSDCLVDVFGRVGLESLLLHIPFVCKSWYQALLNPLCWKQLNFPDVLVSPSDIGNMRNSFRFRVKTQYGLVGEICGMKLVKGVVDRSAGCATYVELPIDYGSEELSYVADKCPALKTLVLESPLFSVITTLSSVMGKFKNLEVLRIQNGLFLKDIVTKLGVHCQNFTTLGLDTDGVYAAASIGDDEVMAIVSCLPKLKSLTFKNVRLERGHLIKLLNGCISLVHLDVRDCCGFDEDDEQLLKLASHIPTFKSSGSVVQLMSNSDFDYYECYQELLHIQLDLDLDYGSD